MADTMAKAAIGIFGALGGFAIVMFLVKKFGPGMWANLGQFAMRKIVDFDEGDPNLNEARKKIVLSIMVYLELKIPDRGSGPDRRAKLVMLLGERAGVLADELVSQLDDELKKLTQP